MRPILYSIFSRRYIYRIMVRNVELARNRRNEKHIVSTWSGWERPQVRSGGYVILRGRWTARSFSDIRRSRIRCLLSETVEFHGQLATVDLYDMVVRPPQHNLLDFFSILSFYLTFEREFLASRSRRVLLTNAGKHKEFEVVDSQQRGFSAV